jgi:hypothetical protein
MESYPKNPQIDAIVARAVAGLHPFDAVTRSTGVGMGQSVLSNMAEHEIRAAAFAAWNAAMLECKENLVQRAALAYAAAGYEPSEAVLAAWTLVRELEAPAVVTIEIPKPFEVDPVLTDIAAAVSGCAHENVILSETDDQGGEWGTCADCKESGFPLNDIAGGYDPDVHEHTVSKCLEPR